MSEDIDFRFPITFAAADEAVLRALRGLAYFAEQDQYKMKAVKGSRWSVTEQTIFRFTRAVYRDEFRSQATRLLSGHWTEFPSASN